MNWFGDTKKLREERLAPFAGEVSEKTKEENLRRQELRSKRLPRQLSTELIEDVAPEMQTILWELMAALGLEDEVHFRTSMWEPYRDSAVVAWEMISRDPIRPLIGVAAKVNDPDSPDDYHFIIYGSDMAGYGGPRKSFREMMIGRGRDDLIDILSAFAEEQFLPLKR